MTGDGEMEVNLRAINKQTNKQTAGRSRGGDATDCYGGTDAAKFTVRRERSETRRQVNTETPACK